jgi:L-2-hydroxyglutarate oxidase LhgO
MGSSLSYGSTYFVRFGPDTEDVTSLDYSLDSSIIDQMFPAIQKVFKGIERKDLSLDYSGIRSKIKKEKELYTDFWIESPIKNYWECLGIESPGFTSSPAIAKHIVSQII